MTNPISIRPTGNVQTRAGMGCLFVFWLVWTLLIVCFDSALVYNAMQQVRTYSFSATEATLEKSMVEVDTDDEGTSYKPKVRYRYSVIGRTYSSENLRFLSMSFNRSAAQAMLPSAPVGGKVTAYYDPTAPSRSVLSPGLQLSDLVIPIFLLPFNTVSLVGLIVFVSDYRARALGISKLRLRIRDKSDGTEVRFYRFSPLLSAVVAAGASGFFGTIPLVLIPARWISTGWLAVFVFVLLTCLVVIVYRLALGTYTELTIDQVRRRLSLVTATYNTIGRSECIPLTGELTTLIQDRSTKDSDGDTSIVYQLSIFNGGMRLVELREFRLREDAERMAIWLSKFGFVCADSADAADV